jgi:hypothetical protein
MRHRHDVCNSINRMKIGGHYLCTYSDLYDLRESYCKYSKQALKNNRVVVMLPYYETVRQVEFYLENVGIDIALHRRRHSLFILDSVKQFFGTDQDLCKFLAILDKGSIQSGKGGVSVIISNDALIHFGEEHRIIEFEKLIHARKGLEHTTIVCTYNKERWQRFGDGYRDTILNCHDDPF